MNRQRGFTLIEIIVVVAIFASVLMMAYQILLTTLRAGDLVKELSIRGRIGESILAQIRRDLQGIVFQDLGPKVFRGEDRGDGETAEDSLHFYTTAPVPVPPDDLGDWADDIATMGFASVGYVIQRGNSDRGNTLFRRVKWERNADEPFRGDSYFPIYDRVMGFSVRYLDRGGEWLDEWDSEQRFPEEEEQETTAIVEPTGGTSTGSSSAQDEEDDEPAPLVLPYAVDIQLWVQLGDEDGVRLDADGKPLIERYSMVVPLLTTESLLIEEDEEQDSTGESP